MDRRKNLYNGSSSPVYDSKSTNNHSIWVDRTANVEDLQSSRKRELREISPNHQFADTRSATMQHSTKRPRRPDPGKSVYAIQKEAMQRELNTSYQARRQLEEQLINLKAELRNKSETFKRASPQLEEQYNELLIKCEEMDADLLVSQKELQSKQDEIDDLKAHLNKDVQLLDEFRKDFEDLNNKYHSAKTLLQEFQSENDDLNSKLENNNEDMQSAFAELMELRKLVETQKEQLNKANSDVNELLTERERLIRNNDVAISEVEALQNSVSEMENIKSQSEILSNQQKNEFELTLRNNQLEHENVVKELNESLLQAQRDARASLAEETRKYQATKQKLVEVEDTLQKLNEKQALYSRDRELIQAAASEETALAVRRMNELDAELSELIPKYKNSKEMCAKYQAEMRLLYENLNISEQETRSLQGIEATQIDKIAKLTEQNKLFDSQRTELALSLEREKKWREVLGVQFVQSESLCKKLQGIIDLNAAKLEERTHEMHKKVQELETTIEQSHLRFASLNTEFELLKQKEKQEPSSSVLARNREQDNAKIAALEAELACQQELLKHERSTTRRLQNQIQELKGNIRIVARIRPPTKPSSAALANITLTSDEILLAETESSLHGASRSKSMKVQFDRVFGPDATNAAICEETEYLTQSALEGLNVCIFAYGQTGSGKTYTMSGENGVNSYALSKIMKAVSSSTSKHQIHVESVEIYNEQIIDLLDDSSIGNTTSLCSNQIQQGKLSIQLNPQTGVPELSGAKRISILSEKTAQAVLERAMRHRSTAATMANQRSSRSHFVFTVYISTETTQGTLHLVDLAGSERLSHSRTEGDRLKETQAINTSLSSLGNVINALVNKRTNTHIPYRNSKLTYLLQGSLSGNAKTMLLTTLSPETASIDETKSTLRFAEKASRATLK